MEEDERYQEAKKRVKALKDFYSHLVIYIVVNLGLFIINIVQTPDALWFYWPLIGWGIGVAIHGISVFTEQKIFGRDWEERKIKDILDKEQKP